VESKQAMSQQWTLVATKSNAVLGSIKCIIHKLRDMILRLYSALVRHIWSTGSASGSPVQQRHRQAGVSPAEGDRNDQGIGASEAGEEAERAGIMQLGEERVQEGPYQCIQMPDESM